MKKQFLAVVAISSLVLFSCGDDKTKTVNETTTEVNNESTGNDSESVDNTTSSSENLLTDVATLNKAEAELKELPKFKGKEIKVFQKIYFYGDGRIILPIQDPEKPENVDEYTYQNGKWQEPQPLQISGGGNMDDNTFPLSEIKFETVNSIYKQVQEKSKDIEGAEELTTAFYAMNPATGELRWMTSVNGTRGNYTGIFSADGTLKSFDKN